MCVSKSTEHKYRKKNSLLLHNSVRKHLKLNKAWPKKYFAF